MVRRSNSWRPRLFATKSSATWKFLRTNINSNQDLVEAALRVTGAVLYLFYNTIFDGVLSSPAIALLSGCGAGAVHPRKEIIAASPSRQILIEFRLGIQIARSPKDLVQQVACITLR